MHNRGKILLNTVLSFSLKPGTQGSVTSAPSCLLLWINQWLDASSVTFEDDHLPTVCANSRSPSPLPKEKLPISHLIPTALPTLCIFFAWLYTLSEQRRFPVCAEWLRWARYSLPFLGRGWPVASSCQQYCSWLDVFSMFSPCKPAAPLVGGKQGKSHSHSVNLWKTFIEKGGKSKSVSINYQKIEHLH